MAQSPVPEQGRWITPFCCWSLMPSSCLARNGRQHMTHEPHFNAFLQVGTQPLHFNGLVQMRQHFHYIPHFSDKNGCFISVTFLLFFLKIQLHLIDKGLSPATVNFEAFQELCLPKPAFCINLPLAGTPALYIYAVSGRYLSSSISQI